MTTPSRDLKFDGAKPRPSLLPWEGMMQVAWIATYGAEKYEPHSWQNVDNGAERYFDALLRHAIAHSTGELLEPGTGLPHIAQIAWNALACIYFLRDRLPQSYDFSGVREQFAKERARVVDFAAEDARIAGTDRDAWLAGLAREFNTTRDRILQEMDAVNITYQCRPSSCKRCQIAIGSTMDFIGEYCARCYFALKAENNP